MNLNLNTSTTWSVREVGFGQKLIDLLNDPQLLGLPLVSWLLHPYLSRGGARANAGRVGWGQGAPLNGLPVCLRGHMRDCGFVAFPSLPREPPMLCPCWTLSQEPSASQPKHELTGLSLPPPSLG